MVFYLYNGRIKYLTMVCPLEYTSYFEYPYQVKGTELLIRSDTYLYIVASNTTQNHRFLTRNIIK